MRSIVLHNSDLTKGQHFLSDQMKRTKDVYLKLQGEGMSKFTQEQHCFPNLAMLSSCQFYLYHDADVGKSMAKCYFKTNCIY